MTKILEVACWHPGDLCSSTKHSYSFSFSCSPSRNTVPLIIFNYSDSLLFFHTQKNYWIELFAFGFITILVTLSPYYIQEIVPLLYCTVQNPSFLNSFKCLVSNFEIHLTDPLNNFCKPEFLLWTCTPWSLLKFFQWIPISLCWIPVADHFSTSTFFVNPLFSLV